MSGPRWLPPKQRAALVDVSWTYHERLLDDDRAMSYLADRGIDDLAVRTYRLGLVADPIPDHETVTGRLAIPYLVPRGPGPVGMKFRCLRQHSCSDVGCPKYVAHEGMGQRLYNVAALATGGERIAISEGELDAVVATEAGIPCVGVPGVKNFAPAWTYCFEGFSEVLILGDGDEPGRAFASRLADEIPGARAVAMPEGMDITDLVIEEGPEALLERING